LLPTFKQIHNPIENSKQVRDKGKNTPKKKKTGEAVPTEQDGSHNERLLSAEGKEIQKDETSKREDK
jgi:hypothetical protein